MRKNVVFLVTLLTVLASCVTIAASDANTVELVRYQDQFSRIRIGPARLGDQTGLGVFFNGTQDLHFYARSETAPAPDLQLQVKAEGPGLTFGKPTFPPWKPFRDQAQGKDVEVYVSDFQVFLPITGSPLSDGPTDVNVTISGLACTSQVCLEPFTHTVKTVFDSKTTEWTILSYEPASAPASALRHQPVHGTPSYGMAVYLLLAILAGISINVMPCVLPVIPLIIMRLVQHSLQAGKARLVSGAAFCGGMVLFFAAFAAIAAVVKVATGTVLDLNGLFRYPPAVIGLFLGIVFFALVLFDVVTLTLPSSVANREISSTSLAGAIGTGFFAAVLSIPCSGALLGFVLVWAQTQPLIVSSLVLLLMGVGMALPYTVLILAPSLLNRLPRPGEWMDLFKKACAFLLLFIAVKLTLVALPKERLINVLLYGVIFSFCAWMWGQWVSFSSPMGKTWAIRLAAVSIAIAGGLWLLPAETSTGVKIPWQGYEPQRVEQAKTHGQTVLLKFTADWCTHCKVVERRVYEDPQVVETIRRKGILAIKADTTSFESPATGDFKQVYGEAGNVPVTIVLMPNKPNTVLRGIFDKVQILDLLKDLPDVEKQEE